MIYEQNISVKRTFFTIITLLSTCKNWQHLISIQLKRLSSYENLLVQL